MKTYWLVVLLLLVNLASIYLFSLALDLFNISEDVAVLLGVVVQLIILGCAIWADWNLMGSLIPRIKLYWSNSNNSTTEKEK